MSTHPSVSDTTIKKIYPADDVLAKTHKILREATDDQLGFELRMESLTKGNLDMFPPSRKGKVMADFKSWVAKNVKNLVLGTTHSVKLENNELRIRVIPKERYISYSYPARVYTQKERSSNPVFNILNQKASGQLLPQEDKIVGIFLCDAGCLILNTFSPNWNEVKAEQLFHDVFEDHPHLDFVVSLSILTPSSLNQKPKIDIRLNTPTDMSPERFEHARNFLSLMEGHLNMLRKPVIFPDRSKQIVKNNTNPECYWTFKV